MSFPTRSSRYCLCLKAEAGSEVNCLTSLSDQALGQVLRTSLVLVLKNRSFCLGRGVLLLAQNQWTEQRLRCFASEKPWQVLDEVE